MRHCARTNGAHGALTPVRQQAFHRRHEPQQARSTDIIAGLTGAQIHLDRPPPASGAGSWSGAVAPIPAPIPRPWPITSSSRPKRRVWPNWPPTCVVPGTCRQRKNRTKRVQPAPGPHDRPDPKCPRNHQADRAPALPTPKAQKIHPQLVTLATKTPGKRRHRAL